MTPWPFEGASSANNKYGVASMASQAYLAGAAAAAGGGEAPGAGVALPAVDGAGVAATAACGCTAGLIQQA
jgi:hypothetical protein